MNVLKILGGAGLVAAGVYLLSLVWFVVATGHFYRRFASGLEPGPLGRWLPRAVERAIQMRRDLGLDGLTKTDHLIVRPLRWQLASILVLLLVFACILVIGGLLFLVQVIAA